MAATGRSAHAKGKKAERDVRDWLRAAGFTAERVVAGARHDRGDLLVVGWPGIVSIKSYVDTQRAVSEGLRSLPRMMDNADTELGVVIVRRHGKPNPEDNAVIMPASVWLELLRRLA